MEKFKIKLLKFLANKFGFKIVMVKVENGETYIQGDKELIRYCDISSYLFKKEPSNQEILKTIKPMSGPELESLRKAFKKSTESENKL